MKQPQLSGDGVVSQQSNFGNQAHDFTSRVAHVRGSCGLPSRAPSAAPCQVKLVCTTLSAAVSCRCPKRRRRLEAETAWSKVVPMHQVLQGSSETRVQGARAVHEAFDCCAGGSHTSKWTCASFLLLHLFSMARWI